MVIGVRRRVVSPVVVRQCKRWIAESVVPSVFSRVDWNSEIDSSLSFNENVSLLRRVPYCFAVRCVLSCYTGSCRNHKLSL